MFQARSRRSLASTNTLRIAAWLLIAPLASPLVLYVLVWMVSMMRVARVSSLITHLFVYCVIVFTWSVLAIHTHERSDRCWNGVHNIFWPIFFATSLANVVVGLLALWPTLTWLTDAYRLLEATFFYVVQHLVRYLAACLCTNVQGCSTTSRRICVDKTFLAELGRLLVPTPLDGQRYVSCLVVFFRTHYMFYTPARYDTECLMDR
jgi:hypothetical protein